LAFRRKTRQYGAPIQEPIMQLLKRLKSLLAAQPLPAAEVRCLGAEEERAATYWNAWQERQQSSGGWQDWGEHPAILRCIQQTLFGSADCNVFDFLRRDYPAFASAHALSLCCGDGAFEKQLLQQGVFGRVTGIDLAERRVDAARAVDPLLAGRLDFLVGDVNQGEFGSACYEVLFAKAALHHISDLDQAFAGIRRCLKPDAHLVTIDFFGPTRFQWTDAQLAHAQQALDELVPAALRKRADGSCKECIERPTVAEMIAADPSEAVRSGDLYETLRQHFTIQRDFLIGGTLLNLIFTPDILNNFDPDEPAHVAVITAVHAREQALLASGELQADFRFIIAT
jgi:ubiquinone/menaquinone biosynthesis C-methylase UbiE